jgi:hypothetical protein
LVQNILRGNLLLLLFVAFVLAARWLKNSGLMERALGGFDPWARGAR